MNEYRLKNSKSQLKFAIIPNIPNLVASTSVITTSDIPDIDPCSLNLINFLTSMTRTALEIYDPEYEKILPEEWPRICQEKCNRNISLIEGIRNPEKVFPRTKWDFNCSRIANGYDIVFMWYRSFVIVADWANSIPEFRILSEKDQAELLRTNFTTLAFMVYAQCPAPDLRAVALGNGSYIGHEQPGYSTIDVI